MKKYPHPKKGANVTLIQHKIPKYTAERIETVCNKEISRELMEEIKKKLIEKGYPLNLEDHEVKFAGALKEELIKFQKKNNFPYGRLDLTTLKELGIKVVAKK